MKIFDLNFLGKFSAHNLRYTGASTKNMIALKEKCLVK